MYCGFCGKYYEDELTVCPHCGKKPMTAGSAAKEQKGVNSNKSSGNTVTIIVALAVIIFVLMIAILPLCIEVLNDRGSKVQIDDYQDPGAVSVYTDVAEEESVSYEETFYRYVTYSSAYTYKNMPEINYSYEASDEDCFELAAFIENYNDKWIEFVNDGNKSIYAYLRPNTQAYKYAVSYGKKDIVEYFEVMEVNDVRKYGDCYYVWTHEVINEYSSKADRRLEYHWVYKVGKDGSGFYVEDYTKDPHYK